MTKTIPSLALLLCAGLLLSLPACAGAFPDEFKVWQPGVYARFQEKDRPAIEGKASLEATACKNEVLHFQLAAASSKGGEDLRVLCAALSGEAGEIPASAWRVRWVDYAFSEEKKNVSDPLYDEKTRSLKAKRIQPIWINLAVPLDAKAGNYSGAVKVCLGDAESVSFPVAITVLEAALPAPSQDSFYLDLWQHPGAIARYHEVELWSEAHWSLMRAYTRLLAEAGQNPITACIIHDPWASQTRDAHPTMVEWRRDKAGKFSFDFSIFDRYVALCLEEGIPGPINCYSLAMGPGGRRDCPIRYWDEAEGRYKALVCEVGDAAFQSVWKEFFAVFIPHLKEKGWFENTCMAMDEAPADKMKAVFKAIPESFKIALAGNYHPELEERLYDYCVIYPGPTAEVTQSRRKRGQITTFYTCCAPKFPNTFSFSPPVESQLLAWNALKMDCDGYLRWAFASWPEAPLESTTWGKWPSGDTFLVYPGPRSSVRYELLKQGIQDFEAYRLAAKKAPGDPRLAEALRRANAQHDGEKFDAQELIAARDLVNAILAD